MFAEWTTWATVEAVARFYTVGLTQSALHSWLDTVGSGKLSARIRSDYAFHSALMSVNEFHCAAVQWESSVSSA